MSSPDRCMSIGAVAALAGKRPSSIRYYEQIGLLPPATRVSGRRVYGPETVRTLAVIETGQRAGLTLDEIRALLSASPDDQAAIERVGADNAVTVVDLVFSFWTGERRSLASSCGLAWRPAL